MICRTVKIGCMRLAYQIRQCARASVCVRTRTGMQSGLTWQSRTRLTRFAPKPSQLVVPTIARVKCLQSRTSEVYVDSTWRLVQDCAGGGGAGFKHVCNCLMEGVGQSGIDELLHTRACSSHVTHVTHSQRIAPFSMQPERRLAWARSRLHKVARGRGC